MGPLGRRPLVVEEDAVGLEGGGHGGAPGGGVQGQEGAGGLGAQAGQRLLHLEERGGVEGRRRRRGVEGRRCLLHLALHPPELLRRHLGEEGEGGEGAVEAHLE